ncbi:MAG: DUF427 domain-containing protein [Gemmatimonadota bacterium]|nr:DUF427 domain-containing protein [Gemmatimonadota bacterium]
MPRATWNGVTLAEAESEAAERVEGNVYFPPDAVVRSHLAPSDTRTTCPWKGVASYYDVVVGDDVYRDAAWTYPDPKPDAGHIRDHVAFWRGVEVEE